ncbi:hypothetical protein P7K49_023368 [Saguinus oedipus]|uniref:Uncharacterized protein n=1 Tax=Saguinus oedipus TaxID=9490 RepID=A0ABQ9ULF0_SAGOE|nr:hypothetical protein P7K49_023368 [Saguinus oedipus]
MFKEGASRPPAKGCARRMREKRFLPWPQMLSGLPTLLDPKAIKAKSSRVLPPTAAKGLWGWSARPSPPGGGCVGVVRSLGCRGLRAENGVPETAVTEPGHVTVTASRSAVCEFGTGLVT